MEPVPELPVVDTAAQVDLCGDGLDLAPAEIQRGNALGDAIDVDDDEDNGLDG